MDVKVYRNYANIKLYKINLYSLIDNILYSNDRLQCRQLFYLLSSLMDEGYEEYYHYFNKKYYYKFMHKFVHLNGSKLKYYLHIDIS